jgi:hypothetical protein
MTSFDTPAGIWDARTGQQLAVLEYDDRVISARFSPDGTELLLATQNSVTLEAFPLVIGDLAPSRVGKDFAIFLAGLALNSNAIVVDYDAQECLRLRTEFEQKQQTAQPDSLATYLRWLAEDSLTRTVSPWTKITVPDWVERGLLNGGAVRTDLLKLSPTHPLLAFYLGITEEQPERVSFLLDYGLRQLQAPATVSIYGSDRVARYAQEAAGMLVDAKDFERAERCIERALELDPTQQKAIAIRARIRSLVGK